MEGSVSEIFDCPFKGKGLGVRAVREMTQMSQSQHREDRHVSGLHLPVLALTEFSLQCLSKMGAGTKIQMKQKAKALFYWLFSVAGVLEERDHTGVAGKPRTQQTLLGQFSRC